MELADSAPYDADEAKGEGGHDGLLLIALTSQVQDVRPSAAIRATVGPRLARGGGQIHTSLRFLVDSTARGVTRQSTLEDALSERG